MTRLCAFAAALLFVFVILSSPLAGHAASFDCTKAASQVEKLICAEDELSRLDDELAAAYRAVSGDPGAADQVRRDQRQWLAVRNACRDRACIKSAYDRRLADLRAARGSSQVGKPAAAPATDAKPSVQAPATSAGPAEQEGSGVREIRSAEFKHFDGRVRIDAGRAVFSHYDQTGNSYNIVAMGISDGSARNLAEGVRGGRFVAEDARYLVYSSEGANANPLVVFDKRANKRVATVRLRHAISWGHIAGDRLLLLQSGMWHNSNATILVYRLPGLKLERSTEIIGGNDTALWGEKIVSIGYRLGIYDLDLREIAVVEMPKPDPNLRSNCGGGPLRISGDKAVVGANCAQLAVVDLPSARIERIIPTASLFQSFATAEGLLFTVDPDGKAPDVRVIELSSGRELARIGIDASFLAMQGKSLLAMKRKDFSTPVRFTLYEVDFASIRSETSRIARVVNGCRAADQALERQGDLHAALETCEKAGISGYVEGTDLSPELREAVEKYARWLTLSLSRYAEGVAILERLQRAKPEPGIESQVAMAKRKALHLDPPPKEAPPSKAPTPKGVTRVPVDFGAFPEMMQFEGDRIYIARWACSYSNDPGVTLEVLDRKTFLRIKRVAVAPCDDSQQDSIAAIGVVPGYIVLGLAYRYEEVDRPTVAVVDARSLEVIKKGFVKQEIAGLSRWKGRLLACARTSDQPHLRFDAPSARFVAASEDEARACANGDPVQLFTREASASAVDSVPAAETPRYRAFAVRKWPLSTYRITQKGGGATRDIGLPERQYTEALAVPDRDALVLRYASGQRTRFAYFDIEAQTDIVLFELNPLTRPVAAVVWARYLFVTLGRDLLAYDLERRMLVGYEKELIREGFLNNCCGVDRDGIVRLVLDEGRLLALTFDGTNSRVIDLPAYTAGLPARDFFLAAEGK
jgi:uncharacterized protein